MKEGVEEAQGVEVETHMPPLPGHLCSFVEISLAGNLGMRGRSSETGVSAQVVGEPLNLPSPTLGSSPLGKGSDGQVGQAEEEPLGIQLLSAPGLAGWVLAPPTPHHLQEDMAMGGQRGTEMTMKPLSAAC